MLEKPYLLFLADAPDVITAKTAFGIAHWRPEACVGEFHHDPGSGVTVGMPQLDVAAAYARGARTLVVGVANAGGVIDARWIETFVTALEAGLDVASGMHMRLTDVSALREAAARLGRKLHDVRNPPAGLTTGTGIRRRGKRVLTVGTDCSVGKMFTSLAIERELLARGMKATFRATGQTGILIAGGGICVDAVVADFISGATERLSPANDDDHWDVIEGQGSLSHPAFAGVSLGLLHGAQPDRLVVCHDPTRTGMRGAATYPPPTIAETIRLNEQLARRTNPDARVVGIAMNTKSLAEADAQRVLTESAEALGMPAVDPVRTGAGALVDAILR